MKMSRKEKREFFSKNQLFFISKMFSITMNGLFENVTKLNRGTTIQNEIDELIPGSIAGKSNSENISNPPLFRKCYGFR